MESNSQKLVIGIITSVFCASFAWLYNLQVQVSDLSASNRAAFGTLASLEDQSLENRVEAEVAKRIQEKFVLPSLAYLSVNPMLQESITTGGDSPPDPTPIPLTPTVTESPSDLIELPSPPKDRDLDAYMQQRQEIQRAK
jgi:hypothetical protein